jgi:hypothetical protein
MRPLAELVETPDPAWPLLQTLVREATNSVEILPPDLEHRGEALLGMQVTLRSMLGAITYETGGLLVDHGWVRVLGSGNPRLTRSISRWNQLRGVRAPGETPPFVLVADDVLGGFFAINGGAFDAAPGHVCYLPPDTLEWESLGRGHSDFIHWLLNGDLGGFYADFRWSGWRTEVERLSGDMAYSFYPLLFVGAELESRSRRAVPVEELYRLYVEVVAER